MLFEFSFIRRSLLAKRRGLVRFTALAAVTGIAVGVGALMIAQALARGFQAEMQEKLLTGTPHIAISGPDNGPLNDWEEVARSLRTLTEVESVEPVRVEPVVMTTSAASTFGMLYVRHGTAAASQEASVNLGREAARVLGASESDTITITLFGEDGPISRKVSIGKLVEIGLYEVDSTRLEMGAGVYLDTFGPGGTVPTHIEIRVNEVMGSNRVAAELQTIVGESYRVLDWQEANRPLFSALSLERRAALVMIGLIVLVAILNITTTLTLLVNEHRIDIAVLRTCGASGGMVARIFVLAAVMLGTAGSLLGLALGFGASIFANHFGILSLDPQVYSISSIQLNPSMPDALAFVAGVLLLSMAASLYPARKAAGVKPLENLRNL